MDRQMHIGTQWQSGWVDVCYCRVTLNPPLWVEHIHPISELKSLNNFWRFVNWLSGQCKAPSHHLGYSQCSRNGSYFPWPERRGGKYVVGPLHNWLAVMFSFLETKSLMSFGNQVVWVAYDHRCTQFSQTPVVISVTWVRVMWLNQNEVQSSSENGGTVCVCTPRGPLSLCYGSLVVRTRQPTKLLVVTWKTV